MKIAERAFDDDGKLIIQQTHDPNPVLDSVGRIKSAGITGRGENKLVGRIPMYLVNEWMKEAGIRWDDPAGKDVIRKKLLSGEFSALRPWEGTF